MWDMLDLLNAYIEKVNNFIPVKHLRMLLNSNLNIIPHCIKP